MSKKKFVFAIMLISLLQATSLLAQNEPKPADPKPSIEIKFYGYVKLDAARDHNLTSHGNFVMWVQPLAAGRNNDDQFNMTANETRFGFDLVGNNYKNAKVSGKLEFDLYAGLTGVSIAENKPMLQLRHAYFAMQVKNTKFLAGQSWDLISPLNPSTLNYSVMWGSGNIGYRRPQLSLWETLKVGENSNMVLAAGVFRLIGNDLTPTLTLATGETAEGADDGTDAGIPSVQGLWEFNRTLANKGLVRFGVSSLWGRLKAETTTGQYTNYESWAASGHFMLSLATGYGLSGELYTGSNLGNYFGAVLRNSEIEGLRSTGGWTSAWAQLSAKVKMTAGLGIDDPKDEDFASGRSRNRCYFGNMRYTFVPKATVGLELSSWETKYKNAATTDDFRVQTSFVLEF